MRTLDTGRLAGMALALLATGAMAQTSNDTFSVPADWVKSLTWRSIGPAGMGGRVTSLAVNAKDPTTYYVGMATAGLLKTVNNGTTFEHLFTSEEVSSVGDVAVSASDPNIVWVGTGEANPRNSVSYGNGVYKSTDGGKTWKNMGLKGTFQVGAILIHPKNPDIVYVGALGRLWGPNDERGMFRTTDGGKTWEKVLYVNANTGVIDAVLDPRHPDVIYAATWERRRGEYDSMPGTSPRLPDGIDSYDPIIKWGWGSGIYKSTNGGKNWKKLTQGLPSNRMGRIGLDIFQKNPDVLFAVIDCENIGKGPEPPRVTVGFNAIREAKGLKITTIAPGGPAEKIKLAVGDVVTKVNGKAVGTMVEFFDFLRTQQRDAKLKLEFVRGGKTQSAELVLAPRGASAPPSVRRTLGVQVEEVENGLRVVSVGELTVAEKAGIKAEDVITQIDDKSTPNRQDLITALGQKREGNKMPITVKRGTETVKLTVELEDPAESQRNYAATLFGQQENQQDLQGKNGHEYGGVYRSDDGGMSWKRINSVNPRPMYFSKVRVDPQDDNFLYILGISMYRSVNGGQTFTPDASSQVHSDQHALWINPKDGRHMIVGTDGGWYSTFDRTRTWEHHNNSALGQFYSVAVDNRVPYWVFGGLQDNGSWGGPSMTRRGTGPFNEDWLSLNGGDGFACRVDPFDANIIYATSQDGNIVRRNLATGEFAGLRPRPEAGRTWRFNWNTPYALSNHNSGIFYSAGNYVFRSLKRGDDLRRISPEIARTGHGTASAFSESPINPNILWVGTDDGYLWVSRDNGATWTNVIDKINMKGYRWVGSVEASRFAEGRAYVAFTNHRSDDDKPSLWMTEDFGQSWKEITSNLPEFGCTRCLREDPISQNVLYSGTEFGLYVSIDRGKSWTKMNNNLPTVPVYDVAIHPSQGEIVAATHGRSLWVTEVSPVRQMTKTNIAANAALYEPKTAYVWRRDPGRGDGDGHEKFFGQNPVMGATIWYSLGKKAENVNVEVFDAAGRSMRRFGNIGSTPGLYRLTWEPFGGSARPGLYKIVLTVDGVNYEQTLKLELDPVLVEARKPQPG